MSPTSQMTTSWARSLEAGTISVLPGETIRRAMESVLALRRVSACALPRASAMASAKLAKSTVNQSQREICSEKPMPDAPMKMSRIRKTVVSVAPTSTTKITGFLKSVTGFSLTNDALRERPMSCGSNKGRARTIFFGTRVVKSSSEGGVTVVVGMN